MRFIFSKNVMDKWLYIKKRFIFSKNVTDKWLYIKMRFRFSKNVMDRWLYIKMRFRFSIKCDGQMVVKKCDLDFQQNVMDNACAKTAI